MQKNKDILCASALLAFFFFFTPTLSQAMCLKDCGPAAPKFIAPPLLNWAVSAQNFENRVKSPETGDVKNSVVGDMNIHVGHKRVDIKTDSNSSNNLIDASINSTIILGDMNK
jgi:hypothetical protein